MAVFPAHRAKAGETGSSSEETDNCQKTARKTAPKKESAKKVAAEKVAVKKTVAKKAGEKRPFPENSKKDIAV